MHSFWHFSVPHLTTPSKFHKVDKKHCFFLLFAKSRFFSPALRNGFVMMKRVRKKFFAQKFFEKVPHLTANVSGFFSAPKAEKMIFRFRGENSICNDVMLNAWATTTLKSPTLFLFSLWYLTFKNIWKWICNDESDILDFKVFEFRNCEIWDI